MGILDDKGIQLALGRYVSILREKALPYYLICKKVGCNSPTSIKNAWEMHEGALKEFDKIKKMDTASTLSLPVPSYSLLDLKHFIADKLTEKCSFCERKCGVNRRGGERGNCGVAYESRVSTAFEHMGEEPELIPSGTIFFTGCNMHCQHCQNYDISQNPNAGSIWTPQDIANWIKKEEGRVRNINLVGGSPTPNLHNIIAALIISDVRLPIIWNSNFYMSEDAMKLLHGIIDVYLADFKYGKSECAEKLSIVPRYFETVSRNHLLAKKHAELLIRILVLPNHIECCAKPVLKWIKDNLGDGVRVNLMSQYRPCYKAFEIPEISRRLTRDEYRSAVNYAKEIGLWNIEIQGL